MHNLFPISIVEVKRFMMIRVLWRCFSVLMIGKLNMIVRESGLDSFVVVVIFVV